MPVHTFGYSEAIFAGSFLVSVACAPRFKTPHRQRRYIFRSRKDVDQSDWKFKPHAYASTESIIDSGDDIQRFIATIKLKESTASDIFRRLNSYSKQHSWFQARYGPGIRGGWFRSVFPRRGATLERRAPI